MVGCPEDLQYCSTSDQILVVSSEDDYERCALQSIDHHHAIVCKSRNFVEFRLARHFVLVSSNPWMHSVHYRPLSAVSDPMS